MPRELEKKKGSYSGQRIPGETILLNCGGPHFVVKDFSGKPIQLYTAVKRQFNKVQFS